MRELLVAVFLVAALSGCDLVKALWSNTSDRVARVATKIPNEIREGVANLTGDQTCEVALREKYGRGYSGSLYEGGRIARMGDTIVTCVTDSNGRVIRFDVERAPPPPARQPDPLDGLFPSPQDRTTSKQ